MKRDKFDGKITSFFKQGLTCKEISKRVPLHEVTIRQRLKELGVWIQKPKKSAKPDRNQAIKNRYAETGKYSQVAREFKISRERVIQIIEGAK